MDFSKFDEFGNPVDSGSSSGSGSGSGSDDYGSESEGYEPEQRERENPYPLATDVYPEHTEVKHEGEDRHEYEEPVIKPERRRVIAADAKEDVASTFEPRFLRGLFGNIESVRNIALVGALGHGKTELADVFVRETHPNAVEQFVTSKAVTNEILGDGRRFDRLGWTDRLFLEKRRMVSISTEVMALVAEDMRGKSWAMNLVDTPGHPDFLDQVVVGLAMADGVVFCVDVIEGLTSVGRNLLRLVVERGLRIVLVVTKMDRLVLELKLPPDVAHTKLRRVIEEVNVCLEQERYGERVSPENMNVGFASARFGACYTAESLGMKYNKTPVVRYEMEDGNELNMKSTRPDADAFGMRLWGDYRYDRETRQIISSSSRQLAHPFVVFALEPFYKVITHVFSHEPWQWSKLLRIPLTKEQLKMDTIPLLRIALSRVFGTCASLVTMFTRILPSPVIPENPRDVVARAAKFVISADGEFVDSLVRIFGGEIRLGMRLRALGNDFAENPESCQDVVIEDMAIPHVRYATSTESAGPGMIVKMRLPVSGISTLTSTESGVLPPLYVPPPHVKLSIEPLDPTKREEMITAISKAVMCYPSLRVQADASRGEQAILGTGELFMDCVMHDLRNSFADIEIKVSDPFVVFNETVGGRSVTICHAKIDADRSIGIIAEPMNAATEFDLENNRLSDKVRLPELLVKDGWDEMAAESVWAFGPDAASGPNILVDDTLLPKPDFTPVQRSLIERSFVWSCRIGPLCDEMVRGVTFRIVEANLSGSQPMMPAKIIPAVHRAMFAAFLAAGPRVSEPIYSVEIISPQQGLGFCEDVLKKRRGRVLCVDPIQGTPLSSMKGEVPLVDLFGMEVDIRRRTAGLAFPLSWFDRWGIVPGDPLDMTAVLKPLEPSPVFALAREFVVKTRRRKGLGDDVDMLKFFESDELIELASLLM